MGLENNNSWQLNEHRDLVAEVRRKLERTKLQPSREHSEEDFKRKIPKIFRRSLFYMPKKHSDFYNKKAKIATSKTSLQDSLLNLDEQMKINQNILDLQNKLDVTIVQKNGQRKLGGPPPGWTGPPPGPGCEIFVGRIPRNIYEDVIYPIFRQIGDIYEMRLMMNFSGTNRGFCFIMYVKPELAQRAIRELNNYQIRPGWFIGVVESVNNCRLHVTDLPAQTDAKTLIKKIWPVCEDIDKVSVFTNINNVHVKHALISFKTHRSAAMARRRLLPERNNFFDKSEVRIEWAHPKISITNVIEECGQCNDKGEVSITKKIIGHEKKTINEDNVNKTACKNFRKKRLTQNSSKSHNSDIKNMHDEVNSFQQKPLKQSDFYSNVNNMSPCNMNQCICEQGFCNNDNVDESMFRLFDDFKYSMRSDESLSDLSKNSDSDDSKTMFHYPNTNPCYNKTPAFLNPTNCSVVRYPWNLSHGYSSNQISNMHHPNTLYHIPFPWAKAMNLNSSNIAFMQMPPIQHHQNFNYIVPAFTDNSFNNAVNVRSYHDINRTARPILNRNLSSS